MREALKGKKTYIFAAIGAVVAAGGYFAGQLNIEQAIAVFMAAMSGGLAGLRGALSEAQKKQASKFGFYIAVLPAAVLLAGCAQWEATKTAVRDRGAHVADEALAVELWGVCRASTVGAVRRAFGNTDEGRALYDEFCSYYGEQALFPSALPEADDPNAGP